MTVEIGTGWRDSFSGNICFEVSVSVLCSVEWLESKYESALSGSALKDSILDQSTLGKIPKHFG
jgi:hypothetical protein